MSQPWHVGELLGFDLETTGVARHGDVPVSFALVAFADGRITRRLGGLVDPGREIPAEAVAVHGITTEQARAEGMPLSRALETVRDALLDAAARGVPVVGMNLSYDLSMLDHQLRLADGPGLSEAGWDGPVLDVLVLDRHLDRYRPGKRRLPDLCAHYQVAVDRSHDAGADAEASTLVLLALCDRYPAVPATTLTELTRLQAGWHREWATGYSAWRKGRGLAELSPEEGDWPLARATTLAALAPRATAGSARSVSPAP